MTVEQQTYSPEKDSVCSDRIPEVLRSYPQWVCWRYVERGQSTKPDKQPVNPHSLHNAGVHWQNTWATFDSAYATCLHQQAAGIKGIGFVLTPQDPFVAIDIDGCVGDEGVSPDAFSVLETLQSYAEISPSGVGIHILVACPGFQENRRTPTLEIYSHSRYVTMTGHHLLDTPLTIATVSGEVLSGIVPPGLEAQRQPVQTVNRETPSYPASDQELWQRIFTHDQYSAQHWQRFNGDTSLDRGDHSFTVIRLLNCLARWTGGDATRMRALMLMSPLVNDKWFAQRGTGDWLDYQIADAIAYGRGRKTH